MKRILTLLLGAVFALALFFTGLDRVERASADKGLEHLENALRQAAVACYAVEGSYPASISHLQERYGVQIDEERYVVDYQVIAGNLMPSITVLERER